MSFYEKVGLEHKPIDPSNPSDIARLILGEYFQKEIPKPKPISLKAFYLDPFTIKGLIVKDGNNYCEIINVLERKHPNLFCKIKPAVALRAIRRLESIGLISIEKASSNIEAIFFHRKKLYKSMLKSRYWFGVWQGLCR